MGFIIKKLIKARAGYTGEGGWAAMPSTFLRSKKKKKEQREKWNGFKAETIKRLSPKSKYYCFSHSRASRIRKFFLSANHGSRQYFPVLYGPPTLKSISAALKSLSNVFFLFIPFTRDKVIDKTWIINIMVPWVSSTFEVWS